MVSFCKDQITETHTCDFYLVVSVKTVHLRALTCPARTKPYSAVLRFKL